MKTDLDALLADTWTRVATRRPWLGPRHRLRVMGQRERGFILCEALAREVGACRTVCPCRGVLDAEVRIALSTRERSVDEALRELGLPASSCGACLAEIGLRFAHEHGLPFEKVRAEIGRIRAKTALSVRDRSRLAHGLVGDDAGSLGGDEEADTFIAPSGWDPDDTPRLAIVGAGMAALAAVLGAAPATCVVLGPPRGLTHVASGAWHSGPSDDRALHREAQLAVLDALGGYAPLARHSGEQPWVATDDGRLLRVGSHQRSVLPIGPSARVAVLDVPSVGMHAAPLSAALTEAARDAGLETCFVPIELEFGHRAHDFVAGSAAQLARAIAAEEGRARFVIALRRALADVPVESVLAPSILGSVAQVVAHELGRPVGEVVASHSLQSTTLVERVDAALARLALREDGEVTEVTKAEDGSIRVHTAESVHAVEGVVLATGRAGFEAEWLRTLTRSLHGGPSDRVWLAGTVRGDLDPTRAIPFGVVVESGFAAGRAARRCLEGSSP